VAGVSLPGTRGASGLLDKILAQTGPGQGSGYGLISGGAKALPVTPAWQRPGYMGQIRRFAEPRLADDGGDGVFLDRPDVEPDRRSLEQFAARRPSARGGSLVHGAASDDGLGSDRPLLRPSSFCLRG